MTLERSHPSRHAKLFGGGCVGALRAESGIFEDQGAAISERDFFWLPIRTLVELVGLGVAWRPFLVEPVQVRFVVGDPFLDGLPGRLDGLHGLDVEGGWWRAREMDNAQPETVEAEEELIQGRPTALHPYGARHPLRGSCPKHLQAFGVFRFPRGGS